MNYRHIYHAGSIIDIIKHSLLSQVINYYKNKDNGFLVLDAFAGIGLYDLLDEKAKKTLEAETGIKKFFSAKGYPEEFNIYFEIIKKYVSIDLYPGSPFIISHLIRPQDQAIFCELHKEDSISLLKNVKSLNLKNLSVHKINAYNAVKAFLPPSKDSLIKRGVIFLDPPFEVVNEFELLVDAIQTIDKRFKQSCIIIWYPIKERKLVDKFYQEIRKISSNEIIISEFDNYFSISKGGTLTKTGLVIINPTYGIDKNLKNILNYLEEFFLNKKNHTSLVKFL